MNEKKEKLTAKQEKILKFLYDFLEIEGYPPTYKDIAKHFQFSSDGTVRTYLEILENKGYIQRMGKARGIKILKKNKTGSIPVIGKIAAGEPIPAIEIISKTIRDIPQLKYKEGRFALEIKGDSMKDIGILNNDLVIIQTGVSISNGQIAAVLIDDEATLKRVFYEDERIRLQPENKEYEPLFIDSNTFQAKLIGKYIALIRV